MALCSHVMMLVSFSGTKISDRRRGAGDGEPRVLANTTNITAAQREQVIHVAGRPGRLSMLCRAAVGHGNLSSVRFARRCR